MIQAVSESFSVRRCGMDIDAVEKHRQATRPGIPARYCVCVCLSVISPPIGHLQANRQSHVHFCRTVLSNWDHTLWSLYFYLFDLAGFVCKLQKFKTNWRGQSLAKLSATSFEPIQFPFSSLHFPFFHWIKKGFDSLANDKRIALSGFLSAGHLVSSIQWVVLTEYIRLYWVLAVLVFIG